MENLGDGVDGLRVGLVPEMVDGVAPDVAAQVRRAAEALAAAGANVTSAPSPSSRYGLPAYYVLAPAEASSNLSRYDGVRYGIRVDGDDVEAMMRATRAAGFGAEVKRRIMLGTYALSAGYYDAYYGQAQKVRTLIINAFADAYQRFDVLLGATTPTTAFPLGAKVDDPMAMYLSDVCTVPSNLAGHPAISVPFGADGDGLPIGVQVLAPALCEPLIFRSPPCWRRAPRSWPRPGCAATGRADDGDSSAPAGAAWEPVIGLEVHCELRDRDEALLRVSQRLRRRAQHQHLPRLPGAARLAARAQRQGGGVRHAHRHGPALRDPAVAVPPEELLLSRHAQGLSDQPVRRAHQRERLAGAPRRQPGAVSSGPTWKRTPARPPTSVAVAASTTPTIRWSTTTGPASPWSRSSPRPTSARPPRPASTRRSSGAS